MYVGYVKWAFEIELGVFIAVKPWRWTLTLGREGDGMAKNKIGLWLLLLLLLGWWGWDRTTGRYDWINGDYCIKFAL